MREVTTLKGAEPRLAGERGRAVLVLLLALLFVAGGGALLSHVASGELEAADSYRGTYQALYAADGGAEHGLDQILALARSHGRFPDERDIAAIVPPALASARLTTFRVKPAGPPGLGRLTTGFFAGLSARSRPFVVVAAAEAAAGTAKARVEVSMRAELDLVPVFQFAAFFDGDLEILPRRDMLLSGAVHANGDVYLGATGGLTLDGPLTGAGDVFNRRKDGGEPLAGDVRLRAGPGNHLAMAGLDAHHAAWAPRALERWRGDVRSGDHGVEPLRLVIEHPSRPRGIIEPATAGDTQAERDAKIWYEAGLRIVNGRGFDPSGEPVSLLDPVTGTSAVRPTVIFDQRERRAMLTTEIDLRKLARAPGYPSNGIVYAGGFAPDHILPAWQGDASGVGPPQWAGYAEPWSEGADTAFAVKLIRGAELAAPLTVVSDNPLYVQGDYNTEVEVAAALIADTVTVLSNRWGDVDGDGVFDDDLSYSRMALERRVARSTAINAAVMAGAAATVPGAAYGGGLENMLRLLEQWRDATLSYRGSIIGLWRPLRATAPWLYGAPVYSAPRRDWRFDDDLLDLANLPPGTPHAYSVRVVGWERG